MRSASSRKVIDRSAAWRISAPITGLLERTRDIDRVETAAAVELPSAAAADRLTLSIVAKMTSPVAAFRVCFVTASPSSAREAGNDGENLQPLRSGVECDHPSHGSRALAPNRGAVSRGGGAAARGARRVPGRGL